MVRRFPLLGITAMSMAITMAIPSCGSSQDPGKPGGRDGDPYVQQAQEWELADVAADVESAIARGDLRFLAVTGEGVYVPGLSASEFPPGTSMRLVDRSRFRVIDDTFDEIRPDYPESHRRFKKAASEYARKYNLLLKAKVSSKARVIDRKAAEKRWRSLFEICGKYFAERGRCTTGEPTPVQDAAATLRLLKEAPATDHVSRFYAVRILGRTGGPEARAILLSHLRDPQPDMKVAAIHALGDYIGATGDPSLVPVLINALVFNMSYFVDRFEGGVPKGKLYAKSQPNCGLNVVTVNEEAAKVLKQFLGKEIRLDTQRNREQSVVIAERWDAANGIEKKAKNYAELLRLRDEWIGWWGSAGRKEFESTGRAKAP